MAKKKAARKRGPEHIVEALWPLVLDLNSVELDERNANKHTEKSIAVIAASLRSHKQQKPIWIQQRPDGTLVVRCGNGTVQAARLNDWPTIAGVVVECDDATAIAYAITDNASGRYSSWDQDQLAELLGEIEFDDSVLSGAMSDDLWVEINEIEVDTPSPTEENPATSATSQDAPPAAAAYHVLITVDDEILQAELIESIMEQGHKCRAFNV